MIFIGTVLSLALAASSALAAPLVDVDITKRAAASELATLSIYLLEVLTLSRFPVDQLVGYATQNGGTTGGTGGKVTTGESKITEVFIPHADHVLLPLFSYHSFGPPLGCHRH